MQTSPSRSSSVHFTLADAVRATAIIFVVTSHIFYFSSQSLVQREVGTAIAYWGVDAFFILSGFLLGRPYVDAVLGRRALPNTRLYATRRFLRIWPAYAVIVVVNAIISSSHHARHPATIGDVATHLLMVHNFFVRYLGGLNAPLWTMAVDAQFYVALPLVASALIAWSPAEPRQRANYLKYTIIVAIVMSLCWRFATMLYVPLGEVDLSFVWDRNIVGMAMCFALGAMIAMLESDGKALSNRAATLSVVGGAMVLGMMIPIGMVFAEARARFFILDVLGSISVVAFLLGLLHVRWSLLTRLTESRFVSAVAANSYALYLIHYTLLSLLAGGFRVFVHGSARFELALTVAFLALAPPLAALYHRFVEEPFLSMKERARETLTLVSEPGPEIVAGQTAL